MFVSSHLHVNVNLYFKIALYLEYNVHVFVAFQVYSLHTYHIFASYVVVESWGLGGGGILTCKKMIKS